MVSEQVDGLIEANVASLEDGTPEQNGTYAQSEYNFPFGSVAIGFALVGESMAMFEGLGLSRYSTYVGWVGATFTGLDMFNSGRNIWLNPNDAANTFRNVNNIFIGAFSLFPGWGGVGIGLIGSPIQTLGETGAQNFRNANTPFNYYHVMGGLSPSDSTLKTDIHPLENSLENVLMLQAYRYKWKDTIDEQDIGIMAQELEKIYPEMVTIDTNGKKIVYYYKLIPVLIEAIKEHQILIEEQRRELKKLKSKIE